MLDRHTEMMLQVAATLTAEDLDTLRGEPVVRPGIRTMPAAEDRPSTIAASADAEQAGTEPASPVTSPAHQIQQPVRSNLSSTPAASSNLPRGEYERQRTRESKISTACIGREREKHEWWPVGTDLVGRMSQETFTAMVVENPQVKSGRSILITSGPASGKVCITPTRAAIEATEQYRQANSLGRGGGVTNGWDFWQPRT